MGSKTGVISGLILIGLIFFAFTRNNGDDQNIFTLTADNLATTGITVGGTVVAQKEVDLSFETSGRIAQVSVNAGDRVSQGQTIASLNTGIISANILKAQADLDAEIAKLNEFKNLEGNGLTEVESNKNQLVREMKNAHVIAEDAIKNKTDQFFNEPDSRFPEILTILRDYELRKQINIERYQTRLTLEKWQELSNSLTTKNYSDDSIVRTKKYIMDIQEYLNLLVTGVNQFESNDTHPQSEIDKYKNDTSIARTNMNNALNDLNIAQEALRSTTSQIPYQEARVKSARAVVQNYQAELQQSLIKAPFAGIITKQDAKVGMSAGSDETLVSMISDSNYRIDTYVPEIYISQIKIGNTAKVRLNSYGSVEEFPATVSYIDPAAAQRDGVASYKVELIFDKNDERVKSGMTGDVEIMTEVVNPTFWVPVTAITDQGGATYVKVKSGEIVELRKIEIGERNPTEVEIKSGLIVGDQLILSEQK